MKNSIKLYNRVKKQYEIISLKKIEIGSLPYQLAYNKFLLGNGMSLNQTFGNSGKLNLFFDDMYGY